MITFVMSYVWEVVTHDFGPISVVDWMVPTCWDMSLDFSYSLVCVDFVGFIW